MLTIGLSVSSRIKLLERSLMLGMRNFSRLMQEAAYPIVPVEAADMTDICLSVVGKPKKPRVAKTTWPDERLGFNDTFLHIRSELDAIYKERNPIFNNTIVPELWINKTIDETSAEGVKTSNSIDGTLAAHAEKTKTIFEDADTPALWISKTVLPGERLDFNDTFRHVRSELDAIYKERNPIFNNTIDSAAADTENGAEKQEDKLLSLPIAGTTKDRNAVKRGASLAEDWVSIPAVADL